MAIAYGMFAVAMVLWMLAPESKEWSTIVGLWMLVWLISMFSLMTKRLHDLNISSLWLPVVLMIFAFAVTVGQPWLQSAASTVMGLGIILLGCVKGQEARLAPQ